MTAASVIYPLGRCADAIAEGAAWCSRQDAAASALALLGFCFLAVFGAVVIAWAIVKVTRSDARRAR